MNSMNGSSGYRGSSGEDIESRPAGKDVRPKGYRVGELQTFDKNQMGLYNQGFTHLDDNSYLAKLAGGDQSMFEEMEAPFQRQFQEDIGELAGQFSGMGMGARRGSGFQNAANQSAQDFAMQLQGQRQQYRENAMNELMQNSEYMLNQRPKDRFLVEKQQKKNVWGQVIGAGLQGAAAFSGSFGGGAGGADAASGAASSGDGMGSFNSNLGNNYSWS